MRVVEWEPLHQDALERVLYPADVLCAQARPFRGPAREGPEWRVTLVAEMDGEPVGCAVALVSHWHPRRIWASVEVAADHRRQGIGTRLLEAVRERARGDGRPLRGKVFAGSAAAAFATNFGFGVIQRSRTFRIEKADSLVQGDFAIEAPAETSAAAAAFRDFYVSSHGWDPPGAITLDDIMRSHVADAVSTIVVRSSAGEPLAVGCLYDEDGDLVLSGGPTAPTDPRASDAVAALLDAVRVPVLVEADDSVPTMVRALTVRGATVIDEVHLVAEA